MKRILWNSTENRLRAPWRVLALLVIAMLISRSLHLILPGVMMQTPGPSDAVKQLFYSAVIVFLLWLTARYVDRRPFGEYGLWLSRPVFWLDLGFGLLVSMLLISLVFLEDEHFSGVFPAFPVPAIDTQRRVARRGP